MTEDKIRHGLAAAIDPICYQTTHDITIPAGTILRHLDQEGCVEAPIGFGLGVTAALVVERSPEAIASGHFVLVMA